MPCQKGYVLVTGLIFLLVLTLVAVVAIQSTTMEDHMSANDKAKARSMEASETLRTAAQGILVTSLFWGGVFPTTQGGTASPGLFQYPPGVTNNDISNWSIGNGPSESLLNPATLTLDMTLSTLTPSGDTDQYAKLYIYKTIVTIPTGCPPTQDAGYEGLGRSMAKTCAQMYFDMRSVGQGSSSTGTARAITYSNFRYVLQ
jgi:hypothetical protein